MPRKRDIVEAASLFRTKSTARVIEWEPKVHSRGMRYVPVEVGDAESQPRPKKKARRRPRTGETPPQPMDVDETFWVDEPVMPSSEKKVRQPACLSLANLTNLSSPSTHTSKNLFQKLALTYTASSILRAFRRQPRVRAASLLHSSGGAPTAFLLLYSAGSAAGSHTSCFLFIEFKNGSENTSCHHGCGRLGCACNWGTLGTHAQIR